MVCGEPYVPQKANMLRIHCAYLGSLLPCLNKGVKAEHLMGADTMGNFMSPETTQQIS